MQRLILVMVPLLAVLVPVFKFVPSLLDWLQQNKLFRHYGALKFLEDDLAARALNDDEIRAASRQLDAIDRDIVANKFALDFSDRVFTLRQHVDYVREKLQTQAQAAHRVASNPSP